MALSCLSLISSQQTAFNKKGPTYYDFTFPTSLGVTANTITSNTYTYSSGTGTTSYLNGNYCMMNTYNNGGSAIYSAYALFSLDNTRFHMTGVVSGNANQSYVYSSGTNSSTLSTTLTYTQNAYSATGVYQGGTTNYSQNVKTTYDGSLLSSGEFLQIKFPFNFVFRKLTIAIANNNTFGPKSIRLLGSNDNTTWTQIYYIDVGITYTQDVSYQIFDITSTNTTAYLHHRLVWEKNGTGNTLIFRSMVINGQAQVL